MPDAARTNFVGKKQNPYISKSTFLSGLQCNKFLWYRYNAKDQIPAANDSQQAIFDQGHEVGALAKTLFPDGIEIGLGITDLDETVRLTKDALKLRKPMFEAAFSANGGYPGATTPFVRRTQELSESRLPTCHTKFQGNGGGLSLWDAPAEMQVIEMRGTFSAAGPLSIWRVVVF